MSAFWLLAAAMTLLALAFVIPPLLRGHRRTGKNRNEQNVLIAREQLRALQTDQRSGAISNDQFEASRDELEQALFDDLRAAGEQTGKVGGKWLALLLAVFIPLIAFALYGQLGSPKIIPLIAHDTDQSPENIPSIEGMVNGLAKRLQQQPDDAEGWYMLGQSCKVLKRYPESVKAFANVRRLTGDQPDVLVQLADVTAVANNEVLAGEPMDLLEQALELDAENVTGLWLMGIAQAESENYEEALLYWRRLEPLIQDDPEATTQLYVLMAAARKQLANQGAKATIDRATSAGSDQPPDVPAVSSE